MLAARKLTPRQLANLTDAERVALAKAIDEYEREQRNVSQVVVCPDPVEFAQKHLGITPWSRQAEILQAVREHPKVAVRSGHKIGKSTSCAILALWWWATRPRALVVMTSSTDGQVKDILWPEVRRLYRHAPQPLGGVLYESHHSGLKHEDERRVIGISTNRTENMGGFSGADLLFIADEASGIEDTIFDAIEGNRAGGAKVVMFGNPTRTTGRFYHAFHEGRQFWKTLHISSTESPNVTSGRDVIAGLATRAWVEEKTAELGGPGNPEWDIRIGGNFPQQGENSLVGLAMAEQATKDWRLPKLEDGPLEIGVDVARYGADETVICARRGKFMYPLRTVRAMDGHEVAAEVMGVVRALRFQYDAGPERAVVKIDSIGVGASPYDVLRRIDEIDVEGVDAGMAATASEDYYNLRSQLWFALRDWLRSGGKFKEDVKTHVELIAVKYFFDARGRKRVESKEDIKAQIHRSPDRADAMALAVYNPPRYGTEASYDNPIDARERDDAAQSSIAKRIEDIEWGR